MAALFPHRRGPLPVLAAGDARSSSHARGDQGTREDLNGEVLDQVKFDLISKYRSSFYKIYYLSLLKPHVA